MKKKWLLSFLFFILSAGFLSYNSYCNRVYDWDMPGYLGCLYASEYKNSEEEIHKMVYTSIKKEASEFQVKDISGTIVPNRAIQVFSKSPQAFFGQLPYYKIKILYNVAISALYQSGFSGPHAILLVSIFSYLLSGVLLFIIFKHLFIRSYLLAPLLSLAIMLLPTARFMSETPSPDMLGFTFFLLLFLGFIKKWRVWQIFPILVALVLVRPDYIIFSVTYLLAVFSFGFFKSKAHYSLFIQGFLLFILYFFIIKYYNYPGWKMLFYDTFISRRAYLSEPAAFSFSDYLHILSDKFLHFKKVSLSAAVLLILVFSFTKKLYFRLSAVLLFANIYLKFILFPDSAGTRFFFAFLILLFLLLMYTVSKKFNHHQINENV